MNPTDFLLLGLLLLAALWAVWTRKLMKSALALAATSIVLAMILYRLDSPLAAVFELSVCAGLITAIFISTISLTQPKTPLDLAAMMPGRIRRYAALPVILLAVAGTFALTWNPIVLPLLSGAPGADVRDILWNQRPLDLIGQMLMILAGVFGVVVLFKGSQHHEP